MATKVLIVGVVMKHNAVLMRKKPEGSAPYKETWYLFGTTATPEMSPDDSIVNEVKNKAGINIAIKNKISWDTEVKNDLDGIQKFFIYLDVLCEYVSGNLVATAGIEKLEWVNLANLKDYDIAPPSRILFEKLGYL